MKKQFITLGTLSIALILAGFGCSKATTPISSTATNNNIQPDAVANSNNKVEQPLPLITDNTTKGSFLTYTNDTGISIGYPSDWSQQEGKKPILVQFFSPLQSTTDKFQESVSLMVQDFSTVTITLEQFDKQTTSALAQYMTDLKITKQENIEINGKPGKMLTYTGTMPGQNALSSTFQAYTVSNNIVYLITYTGKQDDFEKFLPTVQKMLKTIVF
ncbi:MAG: hypothetical protein COY69_01235 [Candidatus Magasanikbacteria bacterium CG_4_10_14_0_8_um_filter_32_14]|uniref:PsbP C-terminal domain-containing protein n=1 Tax=Candidatus Magasanikbacteria bacterium CG_4_10_14_0_8_um_filter_32_14 TaxID=1974640 RepID=A0A2M7R9S7_9BACT|nr:MAG: hypothetical protein COY69_01235 [Candidatus Magasanikbacteria bacterium CG_4_10_14_0_8_um_filter_32_14]